MANPESLTAESAVLIYKFHFPSLAQRKSVSVTDLMNDVQDQNVKRILTSLVKKGNETREQVITKLNVVLSPKS